MIAVLGSTLNVVLLIGRMRYASEERLGHTLFVDGMIEMCLCVVFEANHCVINDLVDIFLVPM